MQTDKGDGQSMKRLFNFYMIAVTAFGLILLPAISPDLTGAPLFQDEAEGASVVYEDEEAFEAAAKEYNEVMKAAEEPDLLKRGEMLIAFIKTYPESDYIESYAKPTYELLLRECNDNNNFEALEILAEKWLELHPDNINAVALAARSAVQLGHDEKSIKYALKIYEIQPTVGLAYEVAQTYDRLGNFEEYVKWCETYFTYPEADVDYTVRFKILTKYAEVENYAKAAEYAEKTLEVLESAARPDAAGQENIPTIKRICNHIIGINHFEADRFKEAIQYFENALKAECYQEGLYYIARCHWGLSEGRTEIVVLAHDFFAAAELFGGELTQKAKEYKEQLYKPLHYNSLVGIEKVHKRAQEILDRYPDPRGTSTTQKKTELSEVR